MKRIETSESRLWKIINSSVITRENIRRLSTFKSGSLNFKISLWNPQTNGTRYLKALIYNLASSLTHIQWAKIDKIKNRDFGGPIVVRYNNREICLDYLQALFELEFIEKNMRLDNSDILEIGAGYGRTCHAIISNHNVKSYSIVDLRNCLQLSRKYLKNVLGRVQFSKVHFITADGCSTLPNKCFDLAINIDSFAEMEPRVVRFYLNYVKDQCRYFYVKNPVGKYLDKTLDNHNQGARAVFIALHTGILRDVIDIHDSGSVSRDARKFLKVYNPGASWRCIDSSWAKPWSFYWNSFYKRTDNKYPNSGKS